MEKLIRELWERGISIEEISNVYDKLTREMENEHRLVNARDALAKAMVEYIKCLNPGSKLTAEDAMKDIKEAEPGMRPVEEKAEVKKDKDAIAEWLKENDFLF